ncbi:hypothetical protein EDC17_100514 [Sphingobacterium alimentarium]|uniref:Uncharacterized protein n=1 Tax=Sphingobacterium alimentarium TaxID=797292 RepID=A0A4R3W263_9SPHI|nr:MULTISPECIES: hypothetical protein [Sphingobacterium]TCV19206.1 hypothetical protein EDC17_100514 [Sphingobacterium alimentarium]
MEALSDLNTFAKILTDKGYNGYFHTQGAYAGKLKDSISDYLESCQKGADTLPKQDLLLTGYLQWSGDDKPRVQCSMWVKYLNGKFSLNRIEVARKDQFGQLLKKSELANLSVISAPKAVEAVALVKDAPKQKAVKSPKRFKL